MNTDKNSSNEVEVRSENLEPPSWISAVAPFATHILSRLGIDGWILSILFCDDAMIRWLNHDFRGIDAVTDVLSFSDREDTDDITAVDSSFSSGGIEIVPGGRYAGDIVLALPQIQRQAEEFSVPYEQEVRRMLVHGILHLAGYSHDSNDFSREPMLQLQEEIVHEIKETLF